MEVRNPGMIDNQYQPKPQMDISPHIIPIHNLKDNSRFYFLTNILVHVSWSYNACFFRLGMSLAPEGYDFGEEENYSFAMNVTCANEEARKMFVEAFGHMLNYNHEQASCFSACAG